MAFRTSFPFFTPAYIPGNHIRIYGCHAELAEAFRRQQSAPCFPVEFDRLGASIDFVRLEPGRTYEIAGCLVTAKLQRHTNDSYGYRFEQGGKILVYSTDSEHKLDDDGERREFVGFFRDADFVIFDAMYSLADAISVKEDWGHSSNIVGVELCQIELLQAPSHLPEQGFGKGRVCPLQIEGRLSKGIWR